MPEQSNVPPVNPAATSAQTAREKFASAPREPVQIAPADSGKVEDVLGDIIATGAEIAPAPASIRPSPSEVLHREAPEMSSAVANFGHREDVIDAPAATTGGLPREVRHPVQTPVSHRPGPAEVLHREAPEISSAIAPDVGIRPAPALGSRAPVTSPAWQAAADRTRVAAGQSGKPLSREAAQVVKMIRETLSHAPRQIAQVEVRNQTVIDEVVANLTADENKRVCFTEGPVSSVVR